VAVEYEMKHKEIYGRKYIGWEYLQEPPGMLQV
jgi:hypothetical protein